MYSAIIHEVCTIQEEEEIGRGLAVYIIHVAAIIIEDVTFSI
jgi:hypothetical protein